MKNLISTALNRHEVSENYHSKAYPYFLRSQGPYSVYDHAKAKGQQYVRNLQTTNDLAHKRFKDECLKIKDTRHQEREQFDWQKKKQDLIATHNDMLRRQNNLENNDHITQQIELDQLKKMKQVVVEKKYYKPHFGPEETDETMFEELKRSSMKKHLINDYLNYQIDSKSAEKQSNFRQERINDLENLKASNNMFLAEEQLMKDKKVRDK